MEFEFKIKVGETEITIKESAKTHTEFFEKISFFNSLPKTGPNGETDLVLKHKNVDGYDFYSVVSKKAGKELRFGQAKKGEGVLFPKGWEDLYQTKGAELQEKVSKPAGTKPTYEIPKSFNIPKPSETNTAITQEHKTKAQEIAAKYGFSK